MRCSNLVLRHVTDWQGTAGTAVAGIYGALAVQGKPVEAITEQRVVMVGAGSAGMGVVQMLALGMVKHVSLLAAGSPACEIGPNACKIVETGGMHAHLYQAEGMQK